jgi:hypothetical protein
MGCVSGTQSAICAHGPRPASPCWRYRQGGIVGAPDRGRKRAPAYDDPLHRTIPAWGHKLAVTKYVSVLYAGHVLDAEGIGFAGILANDRWYANERCARAFDIGRDLAQHTEELGYDILWLAEHHFQREGYECIPNVLLLSPWLAQQTSRLTFGCAFDVLPMWHPLRLAEDFAMVDIPTHGWVIFGMGRGYHTREVETFGSPRLEHLMLGFPCGARATQFKTQLTRFAQEVRPAFLHPDVRVGG